MREKHGYSRNVILAVSLTGAVSLLATGAAIVSYRRAVGARDAAAINHATELVLVHQLALLTERKLAKSRSFIITGDEAFSEEMEDARAELRTLIGELRGRLRSDEAAARMSRVEQLEAGHHARLRELMSLRRRGRRPTELAPMLTERLKPVRDMLDAELAALIALKTGKLDDAQSRARESARWAQHVSLSAAAAAAATFALALWLVRGLARAQAAVERSLRRSNTELDELVEERTKELSAFNRELESFSYAVAHDLRTPLRAVTNYADLALAALPGSAEPTLRRRVERMREAGLSMSRTIDALLALSRLTRRPMEPRDVDLSALAAEVIGLVAEANPGRRVAAAIQPGLADRGDPELLRVVLQNLLDNAWKFTAGAPDARVEFAREEVDGGPAYVVRDNGAGFDPDYAEKLFRPFERLHSQERYPGSGIGLAAVERVVRRHGGSVWAESRPGQGAAFYFTLHRRLTGRERAEARA